MSAKKVVCLFCDVKVTKKAARKHSCPEKQATERRLGAPLAVYDAVEHSIEK